MAPGAAGIPPAASTDGGQAREDTGAPHAPPRRPRPKTRMRGGARPAAAGRPLQRTLLRFLLEQEGYKVVSEAATGSAAAEMAGRYRPDVVVLHETLALESPDVVRLIRRAPPRATA